MHFVRHHVGEGEESPAHGPQQLLRGRERLHHPSGGGEIILLMSYLRREELCPLVLQKSFLQALIKSVRL